MLPLKEDDTYAVLSEQGMVVEREEGFYRHDTRYLSRYRWNLPGFALLLSETPRPDRLLQHWALIVGPDQKVGLRRELVMLRGGFREQLQLENTSLEPHTLELSLEAAADFADLFEARGWHRVTRKVTGFSYTSEDGLEVATRLETQPAAPDGRWKLELKPHEKARIAVEARFEGPFDTHGRALPSYEEWIQRFPLHLFSGCSQQVLEQALTDLRALLFSLPEGLYPAAGIPWYVCPFGRDGLLTAYMVLPWGAEVAKGVLTYLAKHQGKEVDPFRDEAPGKILHEVRLGELSRTGKLPFGRYYGTVDATPLFVILLERYWHDTGDLAFVRQLQPNWEAALSWMTTYADPDGDGLLEFLPNEKGLTVQSWKDSGDSQSHQDGSLAKGAITVSEVQGYAYAAYRAAAGFYRALGQPELARGWEARAEQIKELFHQRFWLPELATYALALDGEKKPLRVLSSNPGHLLWSGIVPSEVAPALVRTMFSPALWSGWGLRTLGAGEVRYNPLSYHNGSVWPHDTAIFAGGLARYGFHREAQEVAEALFRLAMSQRDRRLPELVGGYERHQGEPPVPYPAACRPQAWDAAAVVYLLRVVWGMEPGVRAEPPREGLLRPA
ncbi:MULTISPECIES: glycogen debranching N-terminal domain-containing protein [unclassified Meiothermus]|uniref:amylo-alpha-1,6-glucosidase n=1 Tax=unclassified Meiothermus TaxID=370471 RepID=UPI000D7B9F02|nr:MULTISPECIES: glycogen debranching N-terminal domain-containing protein [unclassified Meiothermus]PZA08198.1 amylo-alpha-1,6-glucosidase [Meiothermus sp. Pnk-1]RYM36778.1 amylo-alpha-1,6-glucosidase [Meiothermus sp. PNK-Is4]